MDAADWNVNKLSMSDVIFYLCGELKKDHGVAIPKSKQKDLFIEAVLRNIVMNEIGDMMLFITDEEKWDAEMSSRN